MVFGAVWVRMVAAKQCGSLQSLRQPDCWFGNLKLGDIYIQATNGQLVMSITEGSQPVSSAVEVSHSTRLRLILPTQRPADFKLSCQAASRIEGRRHSHSCTASCLGLAPIYGVASFTCGFLTSCLFLTTASNPKR